MTSLEIGINCKWRNLFQNYFYIEKGIELENQYQEELTKRWEADSKSDSLLAKNVRPMSLVYLLGVISILAFTDGNIGTFNIKDGYINLFELLSLTAFAAYFGGRTIEKRKRLNN